MKQSMEFNDILNECLERILRGEKIDDCLARYPEYAAKLKPLLDTGLQVKRAASVQPRPEFRADARVRFLATLEAFESNPPVSLFHWLRHPQWAAVSALAVLFALGTITAGLANGSMPDNALYRVKLAMEKIQISLTPSAESRGELYARLLERRITEITRMAEEHKPDRIQLVTAQLDIMVAGIASLTAGRADSEASKKAAPQPTAIPSPVPPPAQTAPVAPAAPGEPKPPVTANQTGITATSPAMVAVGGAAPTATNATPPVSAETGNLAAPFPATDRTALSPLNIAASNLARLRDLLANAREPERSALAEALTAAERNYDALTRFLASK